MAKRSRSAGDSTIRLVAFWLALLGVLGGGFVFAFTIYIIAMEFAPWQKILEEHFAALVGLPFAAGVAFVLVVFLRQTDGPIEFESLGLKFKGAAGQVIMWAVCFLAMAGAIKWVW
jgi:hypothetical protein